MFIIYFFLNDLKFLYLHFITLELIIIGLDFLNQSISIDDVVVADVIMTQGLIFAP